MLNFLQTVNGRKKWYFVAPVDLLVPSLVTQSSSIVSPVKIKSDASLVQSQSTALPVEAESDALPAPPDFRPASDASFTWGSIDSQGFCHTLEAAYQEVVQYCG